MGKTSTAVKRRYNEKTYTRWTVDLRNEDFERIEAMRGDLSRAAFLRKAVEALEKPEPGALLASDQTDEKP